MRDEKDEETAPTETAGGRIDRGPDQKKGIIVQNQRGNRLWLACFRSSTYLLAFYLVIKGFEILQIALASNRESRVGIITLGVVVLAACIVAAMGFAYMQDAQARLMSNTMGNP